MRASIMAHPSQVPNSTTRATTHSLQQESELVVAILRTALVLLAALSSLFGGLAQESLPTLHVTVSVALRISVAFAVCYTAVVFIGYWSGWRPRGRRQIMAVLDMLLVSVWIYLTWHTGLREEGSPLFPFFYILVIINALWFGIAGAFISAGVAAALYLGVAYLASNLDALVLVEAMYRNVVYLFLTAIATGYLVDSHRRERDLWTRSQVLLAKYQERFRAAQEVYELLVPSTAPQVPGLEIGARWRPALQEGGGDFYDVIQVGKDRVVLAIADVAGKSMRGTIKLPLFKAAFLACAQVWSDPGEILSRVNRIVYPLLQPDMFISACVVVIDLAAHRLSYANAGQDPPLFVRERTSELVRMDSGGLVLGVDQDAAYPTAVQDLEPGDTLCLYTDGITEARDPAEFEFGEENLQARVQAGVGVGLSAKGIADIVFEAVNTHIHGAPHHDDMTLVVVRYQGDVPAALPAESAVKRARR
jgi:hypothetical protein